MRRLLSPRGGLIVAAAAVVTADQLTKSWALHHTAVPRHVVGPVWLELTFNEGVAFGLGRGITPLIETVVVALVVALVIGARRAARGGSRLEVLALGLLLGGAVSNLGDRLLRHLPGHPGAVVDWIEVARFGRHEYWPVFNLADASIVVGAALLAWCLALHSGTGSTRGRGSAPGGVGAATGGGGQTGRGEAAVGGEEAAVGGEEAAVGGEEAAVGGEEAGSAAADCAGAAGCAGDEAAGRPAQ